MPVARRPGRSATCSLATLTRLPGRDEECRVGRPDASRAVTQHGVGVSDPRRVEGRPAVHPHVLTDGLGGQVEGDLGVHEDQRGRVAPRGDAAAGVGDHGGSLHATGRGIVDEWHSQPGPGGGRSRLGERSSGKLPRHGMQVAASPGPWKWLLGTRAWWWLARRHG